jgi:Fe-S cluster assembly protein SufA/iron-sulfur cluster assembly protein
MTAINYDPSAALVTLTEAARRHFTAALTGQENNLVRLSTKNSGCSGYAYVLTTVDAPEPDDLVIEPGENLTLAIALNAVDLIRGMEIDVVTEGVNRLVKFNNPNVTAECGCGESFNVD